MERIPGEQIRQELQDAPRLRSFIICNVRPTGRQLGAGSYGTVEELKFDGLVCAGKKLYDSLINPENQGAQCIVDKYYKECKLLSDLRHPHIVQFLGICFLPDFRLPVLVMERLQGSLHELLETTADIPRFTKICILQDVARGLVYLHNHSPSVIHRDLTARNILLNSAMTAKIADLGNSRIADIPPGQLAQTMTQGIPGTLVYMPPEVSDKEHKYGPSLDMFSFGHLSLFVAIQVFPQDLLKPTYQDSMMKQLKARSELERRGQYINILHQKVSQRDPLVVLIKECLEYDPVRRPIASQVLERLGEMRAILCSPYSDFNRLQLERFLAEKEAEVQRLPLLRSQLERLTVLKTKLSEACKAKDELLTVRETEFQQIPLLKTELEQLKMKQSGLEEVCKGKDEILAAKEQEITGNKRTLSDERQRMSSLIEECATLKGKLHGKTEEITSLRAHNRRLEEHVKFVEEEKANGDEVIANKDQLIREKDQDFVSLQQKCGSLQIQLESVQRKNQSLEEDKAHRDKTIVTKNRLLNMMDSEILKKDGSFVSLQQKCGSLQTQLETVQQKIQSLEASQASSDDLLAMKDAHIAALQTELKGKDRILHAKAKVPQLPSTLTFTLPLKWKKPIKIPSGVSLAQAVVIGGKVYVGGGGKYNVLVYTIQNHQWKEIETPVMWFGMAVVNDQLIITGEENDNCSGVDRVWVLDSVSGIWRHLFPKMPTGRGGPSAIGYKRWVFVVGGHGVRCVEVLDTKSKLWYTATPLPFDADRPSLTLVQDTLYAVCERSAVCASLLKLVSGAMSQSPSHASKMVPKLTEWQPLPDTPTKSPTTTTLNGSLIAIGGHPLSSTIAMYLPQTEQWLNVAELPTPRAYCTCALLPETDELIVIGGWDKKDYIKTIDLCTL